MQVLATDTLFDGRHDMVIRRCTTIGRTFIHVLSVVGLLAVADGRRHALPAACNDAGIFSEQHSVTMKLEEKCQLAITATPKMRDAREMNTILVSSIHALFGDFRGENYSYGVKVEQATNTDFSFTIECPRDSVAAVRSALSMVTPPGYLSHSVYRFDVVQISS